MACAASRYLARHEAVQHAPAILERFKGSMGSVASNCATALGKMQYEPAVEVMLEYLSNIDSIEKCMGFLIFLGEFPREDCRDALKSCVIQSQDEFLVGSAMGNLVNHHYPDRRTNANIGVEKRID